MPEEFDKRLRDLLEDNVSGSRIITARTASLFRSFISDSGNSRSEIINRLRTACRRLEKKHADLAAVRSFCDSVVLILDAAPPRDKLVDRLGRLLDEWNELHAERLGLQIASHVYPLVREARQILTHSHSSTVFNVFRHVSEKVSGLSVIQTVSWPVKEGVNMAKMLADLGVKVRLISDAGIATAVRECDLVLVGADSVSHEHVTNKQGTRGLALACRDADVPIYCLTDSTKLVGGNDEAEITRRNPDELAKLEHKKIVIENVYFDRTPLELFTGIVTEKGIFDPDGIRALLTPEKPAEPGE
jgi:translation initiation factor eIF-2B subunit delta